MANPSPNQGPTRGIFQLPSNHLQSIMNEIFNATLVDFPNTHFILISTTTTITIYNFPKFNHESWNSELSTGLSGWLFVIPMAWHFYCWPSTSFWWNCFNQGSWSHLFIWSPRLDAKFVYMQYYFWNKCKNLHWCYFLHQVRRFCVRLFHFFLQIHLSSRTNFQNLSY